MNQRLAKHVEGLRTVLTLFLGLNIAWIEAAYNAAVSRGPKTILEILPLDIRMTSGEWFVTHLSLTILTAAVIFYSFYIVPPRRGENQRC